jgi:diguanylate cyclase (GGDEF)-like protein
MYDREKRAKILIVDDEKTNIDVLVGLLNPHYKTAAAKNGEQAMKRLEHPPLPDLILLDITMPGMDGYEVCRRIKENPVTRGIPVIFITGKNEEHDEAKGFQAGAVDYITKPFSPLIGMARVHTHIELKRRGDMLERLAGLDGLTGINNRRKLDEYLESERKRAIRHGQPISLVILDVDFFKLYNDYYGHAKGDETLRRLAGVIVRSTPRPEDMAARYGGEEFACILPQTGNEGAQAVARRIMMNLNALDIPHPESTVAACVTVSIGIASAVPVTVDDGANLIVQADKALYQAKRQGRNQIVVYEG